MKDSTIFDFVVAREHGSESLTIRAVNDVSPARFTPIAGFNSYEEAEEYVKFFRHLSKTVKLPDYKTDLSTSFNTAYSAGWNGCIETIKDLNQIDD